MGQHFSHPFPDESKDVISAADALSELILAVAWAGSFYAIGMIFTTLQIVDRWRGPRDDNPTNAMQVLGAFILSTLWPVVLVILAVNNSE